jgi:hypothetical protein
MKTVTAPTTARGNRASAAQDTMDMTMPGDTEVVTVAASTFRLLTTNLHRANGHSRCCRAAVTRRRSKAWTRDIVNFTEKMVIIGTPDVPVAASNVTNELWH